MSKKLRVLGLPGLCVLGLLGLMILTMTVSVLAKRPDKPHPNDPPPVTTDWLDLNADGVIDIYDLEIYMVAWADAVRGTDWRGDYGL